jgi:hypothetical protein
MSNEPFYAPHWRPVTRVPVAGVTVWELRQDDHVARCELRNDTQASAGVDVQLLEDGELLLARRSATMEGATYVAEAFRQDYRRAGWR